MHVLQQKKLKGQHKDECNKKCNILSYAQTDFCTFSGKNHMPWYYATVGWSLAGPEGSLLEKAMKKDCHQDVMSSERFAKFGSE